MANIKCTDCLQVKPPSAFSGKQIERLNKHKSNNNSFNCATTAFIRCRDCGPHQVTELKCNWCDKTKGKDKISDTQCRMGEKSICKRCRNELDGMGPGAEDDEDDGSESDDEPDDGEGDTTLESETTHRKKN